MKFVRCFSIMIVGLILTYISTAQNTWVQKASCPVKRAFAVSFSIGNKGYVGTGQDSAGYYSDFWEYNPATDTWKQMADFPGAKRIGAVGFVINNKAYVGCGLEPSHQIETRDFWEYDPQIDKWTKKAIFPGIPRMRAVAFSIGNKGYVGTGSFNTSLRDFWEYNPVTDTWKRIADLTGREREGAVAFSIGNKGYVGTGIIAITGVINNDTALNDFWEYNPLKDKWTQKADIGVMARFLCSGFSIGRMGYIGMGIVNGKEFTNDLWEYDTTENVWSQRASCTDVIGWGACGAFVINDKAYLSTGHRYNQNLTSIIYLNNMFEYSPLKVGMSEINDKSEVKIYPNPTLGRIQIESSQPLNSIEIYDLRGNKVYENTFKFSIKEVDLDLMLNSGVYLMRTVTGEDVSSRKLIID